jgi:hypothetical protein
VIAEAGTAEYFRCMAEHDVEGMGALFAPDAVWADFRGNVIRGRDAIREYYATTVFGSDRRLSPRITNALYDGNRGVVEFDSGENFVVDIFDFDDEGRITEVRIYRRAPASGPPDA